MKPHLRKVIYGLIIILCAAITSSLTISSIRIKQNIEQTNLLLKIAVLLDEEKYDEAEKEIATQLQADIVKLSSIIKYDFTVRRNFARKQIDQIAGFYEEDGGLPQCMYTNQAKECITKARRKLKR